MKTKLLVCLLVIALFLSACGGSTSPNDPSTEEKTEAPIITTAAPATSEVPTTVSEFELVGFRTQISDLHKNIMDNSLAVGNLAKFENQYWENLDNIAGTNHGSDFPKTLYEKGVSFFDEKSEIPFSTYISLHDTIREQYKAIVLITPEGEEAIYLKDTITKLYEAYASLYDLSTNPSRGSRNTFANDLRDYLNTIIAEDNNIKLFIE